VKLGNKRKQRNQRGTTLREKTRNLSHINCRQCT